MRLILQWLFAAALVGFPATGSAQDGVATPDRSQTFTLTLLHEKDKPNWNNVNLKHGAPLLLVLVNGQEVCGLIDTGADRTVVDNDFAKANGLAVVDSARLAKTLSGNIATSRVLDVPVEVPGQFSFKANLVGIDMPRFSCPEGGQLTFVLGLDILKFLSFGIDSPSKRVIFVKSGNLTPNGDNWARFDWTNGMVVGKVNDLPANLKVDTGAASLLLVPANRWEAFFPGQELEELGASTDASGRNEDGRGLIEIPVRLGDIMIESAVKKVAEDDGPEDANLGFKFFIWTFTIFDAGQNLIAVRMPASLK